MGINIIPLDQMKFSLSNETMFPGAPWTHQLAMTEHREYLQNFIQENKLRDLAFSSNRDTYPTYIIFKRKSETICFILIESYNNLTIYC